LCGATRRSTSRSMRRFIGPCRPGIPSSSMVRETIDGVAPRLLDCSCLGQ
jgi:hypothetical protein